MISLHVVNILVAACMIYKMDHIKNDEQQITDIINIKYPKERLISFLWSKQFSGKWTKKDKSDPLQQQQNKSYLQKNEGIIKMTIRPMHRTGKFTHHKIGISRKTMLKLNEKENTLIKSEMDLTFFV